MMEERFSENQNETLLNFPQNVLGGLLVGSRGFGQGTNVDINRQNSANSPLFLIHIPWGISTKFTL